MKKILKILFAIMAPAWFAFSCAHADEVEIVPDVSVSIDYKYNGSTFTLPSSVRNQNISTYWVNSSSFRTSDFIAYNNSSYNYSWDDPANHAVLLRSTAWAHDASDGFLTFDNLVFTLDMSENLNGYYRFESDIYLGLGFHYGGSSDYDFSPAFTVSSVPVTIPDSENGMHLTAVIAGSSEAIIKNQYYTSKTITTDLVHIYIYSTFYYDSSYGTSIDFDASPVFNSLSVMTYDFSVVRSGGNFSFGNYANNRFSYKLFSNVDPPVTPTPTPTPSPNQDIINNNNSNTTNIITTINEGFDDLSAVFQGSIYGLTDLIFGSASDWIDFFSDVQDDMEEYLPVVTFFQSCKNILANFFNVESTDPTALQYIAGWQSDIYTLHIGALPLVLPEGTFNFFPEVNFNLNNPFMNEIRPYWLTFSNVLITLLFLRYLANYLFRWTQLLTGDTSVAFQLFHHAPDELENLGTDPYDLAGDYSYDSIDSANHDLYQDAEAHYGHGAARYLSKVFHSK